MKQSVQCPLISVIVPIYKVESYLDRCIKSIIEQTYKNLEILLVDDGSPDRCPEICDTWANSDKRIRVIHKKNGGLSDARNVGIEQATGDWFLFVDSDDYILPYMCERLLKAAQTTQSDIAISSYFMDYDGKKESLKPLIEDETQILSKDEAIELYFVCHPVEFVVAWNKLYKRQIFFDAQKVRYPVGWLHEDEFTTYKLFYAAKCIVWIRDELYGYVQRDGSIMANYGKRNLEAFIAYGQDTFTWCDKWAPQYRKLVEYSGINIYLGQNSICQKYPELDSDGHLLRESYSFTMAHVDKYLSNPYSSLKDKIKYILLRIGCYNFVKSLINIFR